MSLLLDALKRAAHRRGPGSDAHTDAVDVEPADPVEHPSTRTAQAVFRSTEGRRRAFRRRHAVIVLGVFAFAGAASAAGWMYWQDLRSEFTRDLARYQIDPEPPAAEPINSIEPVAVAADEPETDPAAERVFDEWQQISAAIAAAAAQPETAPEAAPEPEPEPETRSGQPQPEVEPETRQAQTEPEPERAEPEPDAGQAEATRSEPRQAVPMVQRAEGPSPLEELLRDGYQALDRGDLRTADRAYREVLARKPDNRDALLGVATVAHQRGDLATARTHYARVLADEPRDPHAMAGLLALDGVSEPRRAESELKLLLRDYPDAHAIHFALGNLYAAEARWGEAQRAFFEAMRGDSRNPNYAFNLAVALDHLGQRDAARQHYERALELAEQRGSAFAPASARQRIDQLR